MKWVPRKRDGSILVLTAFALAALCGTGASVVDLACGLLAKTRQQAAVDAAALAGATQMTSPDNTQEAFLVARDWGDRNGVALKKGDVEVWETADGCPAVTVRAQEDVPTLFARFFGIQSFPVRSRASVKLVGAGELPRESVPIGIPAGQHADGKWWVLNALGIKETITFDKRLGGPTTLLLNDPGNLQLPGYFVPLSVDKTGADTYRDTIVDGFQTSFAFDTWLRTKEGNMHAHTQLAVEKRLRRAVENVSEAYLPLIDHASWEAQGRQGEAKVIGFVVADLSWPTPLGLFIATIKTKVLPRMIKTGLDKSPGVYAPILMKSPA